MLAKNFMRVGATVVLGGVGDALVSHGANLSIAETLEELLDSASSGAEQAAKKMLAKEEGITVHLAKFRDALEKFALSCSQGGAAPKPLVLLVDELDRCRPNFAIDLLEVLKHIFSVPGVYSVVATDSDQLAHTAQGAYGAGFDGAGYLKRFFDFQYLLPEPERQAMAYHLLVAQGIDTDPVLITPLAILRSPNSEPNSVYRRFGPIGTSENDVQAARAMIVAAISETLELSDREMRRVVELLRAVVDSNEAQDFVPKTKLHFFYLACLCGVFLKDSKAILSVAATRLLLAGTSATSQKVAFFSSIKRSKTVAQVFEFYQIPDPNQFDFDRRMDPLQEEIVQQLFDRNSFEQVKKYHSLVARCGQISEK